MTMSVPPGSVIADCTVSVAVVVVTVFGGERLSTMITEGVACRKDPPQNV